MNKNLHSSALMINPVIEGLCKKPRNLLRSALGFSDALNCFALVVVLIGLSGCVFTGEINYVSVTPISFVPVVGKGGPSCQGWCPTTKDQASHFRVTLGKSIFHQVVSEGKLQGKSEDSAFFDFVREQAKIKEVCGSRKIKEPNSRHIIHTTQNQYAFWTDIECEGVEGKPSSNE